MNSQERGFTLIEILVAVAIIVVLSTIVFATLNSARTKARNSNRDSDGKQLLNAFNLGFATAPLPSSGGTWACVSTSCYGGWGIFSANPTVDAYIAPFIKKTEDPADSSRGYGGYVYNSDYAAGVGYDGTVFTPGSYIIWLLEPPATKTSCGAGKVFTITATYVQCFLKIN